MVPYFLEVPTVVRGLPPSAHVLYVSDVLFCQHLRQSDLCLCCQVHAIPLHVHSTKGMDLHYRINKERSLLPRLQRILMQPTIPGGLENWHPHCTGQVNSWCIEPEPPALFPGRAECLSALLSAPESS